MAIQLTDENFEKETAGADKQVVVDFFAEWCQPCVVLGPILEKLAREFEGKFTLMKANLDDVPLTAQKLGIEQIPTVIVFKNGKPVSGFIGLRSESVISEWLKKIVEGDGNVI